MEETLKVFFTSVSSTSDIKGQQQRIFNVLDSKKIAYEKVDISISEDDKNEMREICNDPTALPPKFVRGKTFLGDYEQFDYALEDGLLNEFLKIMPSDNAE